MYKFANGISVIKVKCSDIIIDRGYQRDLDEARAKRMAASFNIGLFGVPVVSARSNGSIAALDGQHRITARIWAGKGEDEILVEAHSGLTLKQEAELFLRLNGGRTAVRNRDKWRARLVAREPVAIEMTAIAEKNGVRFSLSANSKYCISALNKAERVHRQFKTLNDTLSLLIALGDGDTQWLSGEMMVAVGSFLHKYGKIIDRDILMVVLAKNSPGVLTSRIRSKSDLIKSHYESVAQAVIAEIYNAKVKGKNRLK